MNAPAVLVREALPDGPPPLEARRRDLPALLALKRAVVDHALADVNPAVRQDWKERFATSEYFAERFDAPQRPTTFFLTGPHERPTGMIALKERNGVAYIGDLYVRTPGKGLGHRLLRHALREARHRGFEVAVADVFEDNERAFGLLRAEGFKEQSGYIDPSLGIHVHRLALNIVESKARISCGARRS
jgi:ribosomal protein S18 acetylase RimI-like enzyme